MAMFGESKKFKYFNSIHPIVGNNTTEGTGIGVSMKGYKSATLVFLLGISADTLSGSVKFEGSVEVSADSTTGSDGTWGAAAAASLQNSTLALVDDPAEDDVIQTVEYIGHDLWIRPKVTFTGTHTNGTPIACLIILGHPDDGPVT